MNNNSKLEFKIHYKFTSKKDHTYFYSNHNTKIKCGMIIGFYLRAFEIYCHKFLENELDYIENPAQLQYSKFFILKALKFTNVKVFQK